MDFSLAITKPYTTEQEQASGCGISQQDAMIRTRFIDPLLDECSNVPSERVTRTRGSLIYCSAGNHRWIEIRLCLVIGISTITGTNPGHAGSFVYPNTS